uniref:Uncharacterized protein n=1 Tax=Candidatus Kentrum sp. LPFa TaxID=2126335 RepID=A0A450VW93_9GAMM|nr:MAG: hypothetical protein BECKLPF1236B_GA0070989_100511 [Candidatus Kentron sp. LPFa]
MTASDFLIVLPKIFPVSDYHANHFNALRLLHEAQNLVAQGCVTKIKCGKYLILKD